METGEEKMTNPNRLTKVGASLPKSIKMESGRVARETSQLAGFFDWVSKHLVFTGDASMIRFGQIYQEYVNSATRAGVSLLTRQTAITLLIAYALLVYRKEVRRVLTGRITYVEGVKWSEAPQD